MYFTKLMLLKRDRIYIDFLDSIEFGLMLDYVLNLDLSVEITRVIEINTRSNSAAFILITEYIFGKKIDTLQSKQCSPKVYSFSNPGMINLFNSELLG